MKHSIVCKCIKCTKGLSNDQPIFENKEDESMEIQDMVELQEKTNGHLNLISKLLLVNIGVGALIILVLLL